MEGLRLPELVIILVLIAVLFGGAKLPQLGAALGKAIRGFQDAVAGKDEREQPAAPKQLEAGPTSTSPGSEPASDASRAPPRDG